MTNLATRLCVETQAGQIVISHCLLGTVQSLVEVEPVGELACK